MENTNNNPNAFQHKRQGNASSSTRNRIYDKRTEVESAIIAI
jgi:hypothetical protein